MLALVMRLQAGFPSGQSLCIDPAHASALHMCLCVSWTFMWRFCFVFLFADVLFYLNIENNNPVLFTMLFLNSWFHPLLSFLRWQVEWSSSKRLWKRCRNQNHHKDYISRGCDPEPRKLRTRLTFCSICFQTTWFQVAQTNGLQGENGKDIFEGGRVVLFFGVVCFCFFFQWMKVEILNLQTQNLEDIWTTWVLKYKWIQNASSFHRTRFLLMLAFTYIPHSAQHFCPPLNVYIRAV